MCAAAGKLGAGRQRRLGEQVFVLNTKSPLFTLNNLLIIFIFVILLIHIILKLIYLVLHNTKYVKVVFK